MLFFKVCSYNLNLVLTELPFGVLFLGCVYFMVVVGWLVCLIDFGFFCCCFFFFIPRKLPVV